MLYFFKILFAALLIVSFVGCSDSQKKNIADNSSSEKEKTTELLKDTFFSCEVHSKLKVYPRTSKIFIENPFLFLRIHPNVKRISVNILPNFISESTTYLDYEKFGFFLINAENIIGGVSYDDIEATEKWIDKYQFNLYSGILTLDEYHFDLTKEDENNQITELLRTFYECSEVSKLADV